MMLSTGAGEALFCPLKFLERGKHELPGRAGWSPALFRKQHETASARWQPTAQIDIEFLILHDALLYFYKFHYDFTWGVKKHD